jgi:Zn-finger protein
MERGRNLTSCENCHEEQSSCQVPKKADKQCLQKIQEATSTVKQSNNRIHAITCEQIRSCQDHHYPRTKSQYQDVKRLSMEIFQEIERSASG